ncbi:hypothetical protein ONS95_005107 [Cadophora gregata]|uniref:uncharacterized protein n=1 Tax=Cadophora gregata TaxID=51156 RepID=UPI0026DC77B4|nr:uncharacterized protein ONS95_005107 [Cadophora gregata]KAK0104840.1 hypothetical protein ONS95_005107 [Cadophora gregata]KAK0115078.1 hypothetical protein ONS96_013548 [Cadophora gregata f. sp. sojae]
MNRTNSQFGFAMGLDLSSDVLRAIAYHEGYGQRIHNLYATAAGNSAHLKTLLNNMAAELQYNLTNPGLDISILQRAVTQLLLVQVGDIKLHNTVQHVEDLVRNLRVILAHPMSSGDRKVVMFIQGQADSEKARLDNLVRERKLSILAGLSQSSGVTEEEKESEKDGEKGRGFWKSVGRRIKKSFSGGSK